MIKWVNKKRNTKGFTLMELIIVIAILGILAAIAIPRFGGFTEKAKLSADKATAATISNAAKLYVASVPINETVTSTNLTDLETDKLLEDKEAEFVSRDYLSKNTEIYWIYDVDTGTVEVIANGSDASKTGKAVPIK